MRKSAAERVRDYRMRHPELFTADARRERRRKEYLANKEKIKERSRVWRLNNPGSTTKQMHSWKERFPVKYYLSNANKYALRKRAGAANWRLSPYDLGRMMIAQGGMCLYCESDIFEKYHLDHRIPISKGGKHTYDNLCLACPTCNMRKWTKTDVEFLSLQKG